MKFAKADEKAVSSAAAKRGCLKIGYKNLFEAALLSAFSI
jgi:hypothetical protein